MELVHPKWSLLYAFVQMSKTANSLDLDWNMVEANGQVVEYDHKLNLVDNRPGAIRADVFLNTCRAPKYADAVKQLRNGDDTDLAAVINSTKTNAAVMTEKYGFGLNMEQEIADGMGLFARYSWNDGKTASWEFTDIDRSFQLGISSNGKRWNRQQDIVGVAEAINGISKDHQAYLAAGGTTYIIGDGHLNYGNEYITEAYYKSRIQEHVYVSLDYQLVFNPGYNRDRQGPISVPGLRVHVEF
jgi:carbohydrate-selective porin OprB